ncbi:hypothetical protein OSB04_029484 [Centaurea solstitialis]|uniref:Uncharacterized protein n=1 Tax=Centaurea solstitialis TaxID=347529 RepID=A0AA38T2G2_9ASTR|nr:hypothetical protein OSB04_029484 [Centaurea solstitialis]
MEVTRSTSRRLEAREADCTKVQFQLVAKHVAYCRGPPLNKGVLESGQEVAVETLSKSSQQGFLDTAWMEMKGLLIYEYMSNKSLDLQLFGLELMSPCLRNSSIVSELERTIHVGLLCVLNLAEDIPTMSSVVAMLNGEGALPPPKQSAFFAGEGLPNSDPFLAGGDGAIITTLEPR